MKPELAAGSIPQPWEQHKPSPASLPPTWAALGWALQAQDPALQGLQFIKNNRGSRDQPGNGCRREGSDAGALLWSSPGCTGSFTSPKHSGMRRAEGRRVCQQAKVVEGEVKMGFEELKELRGLEKGRI